MKAMILNYFKQSSFLKISADAVLTITAIICVLCAVIALGWLMGIIPESGRAAISVVVTAIAAFCIGMYRVLSDSKE